MDSAERRARCTRRLAQNVRKSARSPFSPAETVRYIVKNVSQSVRQKAVSKDSKEIKGGLKMSCGFCGPKKKTAKYVCKKCGKEETREVKEGEVVKSCCGQVMLKK